MEIQWDRLLLFATVLSPLAVLTITALAFNWRAITAAKRGILLATLGACAAATLWFSFERHGGDTTSVFIIQKWLLLLVVPLLGYLAFMQFKTYSGLSRGRMWTVFLLRSTIFNLLLLALAGVQVVRERDSLGVVFALDCSKSVPERERQRAIEFIRKTLPAKRSDDEAGLLAFGGKASFELSPSEVFVPPDAKNIKSIIDNDATDIARALRRAASQLDGPGRIVLFTDGAQTAGDAVEALKPIRATGTDVWIVPLARGDSAEMLIDKIVVPPSLQWEQSFDAQVFVESNIQATARLRLYPGDPVGPQVYEQTVNLLPGKNRIPFTGLRMHSGGAKEIHVFLDPLKNEDDTLAENNEAYAFTDVQTDSRILILTSDMSEVKFLTGALEDQKVTLDTRTPSTTPDNPEALRGYDCIVLANFARGFLTDRQMSVIKSCVEDQGAGLIMIGGDQSFGAGGYMNTPVEAALPVQMDLTNRRVIPAGALMLVLDASGSMGASVAGTQITQQEVANKAAVAALSLLTPQDYVGVIAFSGNAEVVVPLQRNAHPEICTNLIRGISPGHGTDIHAGLSAALAQFERKGVDTMSVRHVVLLTDGNGSGGDLNVLSKTFAGKHITISTVGIGDGHDGNLLKNIAAITSGRFIPVKDPRKLPQVLIKEAAIVRQNLIRSDDKGIPVSLAAAGTTLKEFSGSFPPVKAFVVTQPKDRAELQLFTEVDGEKIPILASWQFGLGKAVAFTSDATNRWGAQWIDWPNYKKFWINLVTWASRKRMPSNHTVTTRLDGDVGRVIVEGLDEKGEYLNFAKLTGNVVDPSVARDPDGDGHSRALAFQMTAPGRYEAVFRADKPGAYAISVVDQSRRGKPDILVTGIARSYSAEYGMQSDGPRLLSAMSEVAIKNNAASPLKNLDELLKMDAQQTGVFNHDLNPLRRFSDMFWPLVLLALCLFPLDVAVRRIAWEPEAACDWILAKLSPVLVALRMRQKQIAFELFTRHAKTQAAAEIVPTGVSSRPAQSIYEQAGGTEHAQELDLNPTANQPAKPEVGGTRLSKPDAAASKYTEALLKAKKGAKK